MDARISIEPDGEAAHEPCADCGELTRSAWGYVSTGDTPRATYFVRWTDGHLERGAMLLVSIGAWGEGSSAEQRRSFGFECRMGADRPGFMVVDAGELPWSGHAFMGAKLRRDEALADSLLQETFAILDAIVEHDHRFRRFLLG